MNLRAWYEWRGPQFIGRRGADVLGRYGVTQAKAQRRIEANMNLLKRWDCHPTYPTPGRVVESHLPFIRWLQDAGAEIAVHSYDHLDLRTYPTEIACKQLTQAARVFERQQIEVHGFRCPYLSCTDDICAALPKGMFAYSSNVAFSWDMVLTGEGTSAPDTLFSTIGAFYRARSAKENICVPKIRAGMVEIPVCTPDDLQLSDGLGLRSHEVGAVWSSILAAIHDRGELFTLVFHPELADALEPSFVVLLEAARRLQPAVWMARLREVDEWWREKDRFKIRAVAGPAGLLRVVFECSERATILVKGLAGKDAALEAWDTHYKRLNGRVLDLPAKPRPFLGLSPGVPEATASFLTAQGYIVERGEEAEACAIFLNESTLAALSNDVDLINYIESAPGPLVRYGRWPNGTKSALCVSGDLDALTLLDYASRLFVR